MDLCCSLPLSPVLLLPTELFACPLLTCVPPPPLCQVPQPEECQQCGGSRPYKRCYPWMLSHVVPPGLWLQRHGLQPNHRLCAAPLRGLADPVGAGEPCAGARGRPRVLPRRGVPLSGSGPHSGVALCVCVRDLVCGWGAGCGVRDV